MIYQHRIRTKRLENATGGRRVYGNAENAYTCFIEPADSSTGTNGGQSVDTTFNCYVPDVDADIKVSDAILDQYAQVYIVRGVKRYRLAGSTSHLVATLESKSDASLQALFRATSTGDTLITSDGDDRVVGAIR